MARINLLPWREERRKQRLQEFYVILAGAAMLGLLIFGGAYMHWENLKESQTERNDKLRQEIAILDTRIRKIQDLEERRQALLDRKRVIEELQRNRSHIVKLFDQIVRTIPEGVYLTSLTQQGSKLTLEGIAESNAKVSAYMRGLDSSNSMREPELNVTQDTEADGEERYQFTLVVNAAPEKTDEDGDVGP